MLSTTTPALAVTTPPTAKVLEISALPFTSNANPVPAWSICNPAKGAFESVIFILARPFEIASLRGVVINNAWSPAANPDMSIEAAGLAVPIAKCFK